MYIIAENEYNQKSVSHTVKKDWNVILFFLNIAMVIVSYGAAGFTGMASNIITKPLRMGLIAFSIYYLFIHTYKRNYYFKGNNSWVLWIFILLNLYVLPFSHSFFTSLEKWINLFPFIIYINYFIIYLYRNFDKEYILTLIINFFNIIYALPVISFFLFGGSLQKSDIYGELIGGFVNNHYGWASSLFVATSIDVLKNDKNIGTKRKVVTVILVILALFLLSISGSRSSYLAFIICFVIFIIRNKRTHLIIKIITFILATFFVLQLYANKQSALNKRIAKTETQLEKGEARTKVYAIGFETIITNPYTLITGLGFYAFKEGVSNLNRGEGSSIKISLHNSYYELLFGSGIIVFTFFLLFYLFKTILFYGLFHSAKYVFLPPVLLIPFFENNFNPGQFMFFPWFIVMFYYLHYRERQIKINYNNS